jgi:diguanylate cyclase (GGDEF)-like protein
MRKVVRGPDQIYRLGGDEFTLLLPDTPANAAQRLAARLLQELAAPFQLNGHPVDYITCSIGIAVSPEHAEDSESLIRAADQAMYQAKKQRNSACLYNGPRLFEEGQSQ